VLRQAATAGRKRDAWNSYSGKRDLDWRRNWHRRVKIGLSAVPPAGAGAVAADEWLVNAAFSIGSRPPMDASATLQNIPGVIHGARPAGWSGSTFLRV
jgi:hypothetical protein